MIEMKTNKPLNLKYVSDVIGDDWKQWKAGDVVTINAQTGTGKTTFITGNEEMSGLIDTLTSEEKLIYLCNRTALKRQIKLDLMVKNHITPPHRVDKKGEPIKNEEGKYLVDFKKLDQLTQIKNVYISSYHAIAETEKEKKYLKQGTKIKINFDDFKYIVCDEAHFMLADSAFMTKSNLVFSKIVREKYPQSALIYISATIDEILPPIRKAFSDNQAWSFVEPTLHVYTTGVDYSYLDVKYFTDFKDIITLIHNDKSNDKWIVFVTSKPSGKKIESELTDMDTSCKFVYSGSKDKEIENIINRNKFDCKVLISTKVIDNGINIKDPLVKNIVVAAYDKTTFLQEIGRVRINIENPPTVNLLIKTMNGKIFQNMIDNRYTPKLDDIELFQKDFLQFQNKYNMNLGAVDSDIFYLEDNQDWKINVTGYARLLRDNDFALQMIEAFKNKNKFAFIKEQLKWLEIEKVFDPNNLIENLLDCNEVQSLTEWLDAHLSIKILDEEQTHLRNMLSSELLGISRDKLQSKNRMHPDTANSILQKDLKLPYNITATQTSKRVNGRVKKYTYWTIIKTID